MKICARCGIEKPPEDFYTRSDSGTPRSICRGCYVRTPSQKETRRTGRALAPERAILGGLVQRCHNPRNPSFANYGGRGIAVCERWRASFEAFLSDMGRRPTPAHSIERVDNDGPYSPENCRWATKSEQNRNTRQNVQITIDGVTRCRAEWAAIVGVSPNLIRDRMSKLGWDARRAVFEPVKRSA